MMIQRARSLGFVRGVELGSGNTGVVVSHLQFTNDTVIFYNADYNEIINFKMILRFLRLYQV